ncbi:DoxX family protein [Larkinella insperata]|uniref:DoxX family protein n=1 Tax=Larkinella insperata TaxID=332158 RepID=A0ABW3QAV1_9BACT|nr:DoxX family protein [Larkinella insperata]
MNVIQRVEHWGDTHHPAWIDALRIMLGIVLFLKGVSFIGDTGHLTNLVGGTRFDLIPMFLIHYVAFAHLVGGLLIAMGCMTRLAVLVQLPILLGAVFFVNITHGFSALNSELWLSVVVLLLLLVFLVVGSGRFSVDDYMRRHDH